MKTTLKRLFFGVFGVLFLIGILGGGSFSTLLDWSDPKTAGANIGVIMFLIFAIYGIHYALKGYKDKNDQTN